MVNIVDFEVVLLLTLANVAVATWIGLRLFRNPIKNWLFSTISEYKNQFLDELSENPKIVEQIVGPALKSLAKQYGVPEPGKPGMINLFGLKIPPALLEMGMRMMGGKAAQAVTAANPFE